MKSLIGLFKKKPKKDAATVMRELADYQLKNISQSFGIPKELADSIEKGGVRKMTNQEKIEENITCLMTFNRALRYYRNAAGLTQKEAAELCQIQLATWEDFEACRSIPFPSVQMAILEKLKGAS